MNNYLPVILALAFAAVIICIYAISCLYYEKKFKPVTIAISCIISIQVICGGMLTGSVFSQKMLIFIHRNDIYLLISGIALISNSVWVAIRIWKTFALKNMCCHQKQ